MRAARWCFRRNWGSMAEAERLETERRLLSKCRRPRLETVDAEEHLETDADSPARFAGLVAVLAGPGDTRSQFEHEPVAQDSFPIRNPQPIFSERHWRVELTAREDLRSNAAAVRQSAVPGQRGIASHAIGLLRDRARGRPANQRIDIQRALDIDAAREPESLAVLPETNLAESEHDVMVGRVLEPIARFDERIDGRTNADTSIGFETCSAVALTILNAKQRLILIDLAAAALARDRTRLLLALGDELVATEGADEGVVALSQMRQRHAHPKAKLLPEAVELVPQYDGRDAPAGILRVDLFRHISAEPPVYAHSRAPQERMQPVVGTVDPIIGGLSYHRGG